MHFIERIFECITQNLHTIDSHMRMTEIVLLIACLILIRFVKISKNIPLIFIFVNKNQSFNFSS